MATIKKVSKAKNLSAGPSKKSPIAPKVDPKGQYTKVQERTLGNMKKGGKMKKANFGDFLGKAFDTGMKIKGVADSMRGKIGSAALGIPGLKPIVKKGGVVKSKDGKWIQKAINPKHKGYCTPETKATCTPRRKALAHTLRKMAKKK